MAKDDAFWLNACYVTFALLVAYAAKMAIETLGIQMDWIERYDSWYSYIMYGGAMVIGVAGALFLRSDTDRHEYFLASIGEVKKVTWPTLLDTRRMTIIVSIVVAVFAGILTVFDTVWSFLLKQLL